MQDGEHVGGSGKVAGGAFPGERETCFLGGDLEGREISEGFGGRAKGIQGHSSSVSP